MYNLCNTKAHIFFKINLRLGILILAGQLQLLHLIHMFWGGVKKPVWICGEHVTVHTDSNPSSGLILLSSDHFNVILLNTSNGFSALDFL